MIRLLLVLVPGALLFGQNTATGLRIPLLGYSVSDAPLRVQPLAGSPGAVVLGAPVPIPAGVSAVAVAPGQQFAIVEQAGGESGVLQLTLDGSASVVPIDGSFAHSDWTAFSPAGSVAVLYSAGAHSAQVIGGLPSSPKLDRTVDLSQPSLPLSSLAISDDAQTLLAGFSDGSHGSIWSFAAGQTGQQIAAAGLPCALRFFSGSSDAVAADRGWQQVLLLPHGAALRVLAGAGQGIGDPSDIEISPDLKTVWIAGLPQPPARAGGGRRNLDSRPGQLAAIDLSSGGVTVFPSPFPVAHLRRLAGGSELLITSADGSSSGLWSPASSSAVWQLTGAAVE